MRRLGLLAAAVLAGVVVAGWAFDSRGRPNPLAAGTKPGPDPFGFAAAFDAQLARIGPISPAQFADRHPPPAYAPAPDWDPTTAKFFDKLDVETVVKPAWTETVEGRKVQHPARELPGYRLTADERAALRRNGFVASERLGGHSFGQVYYDVYTRDLPVFVTADSVLHAWHRSYDTALEELERAYLKPTLAALLAGMHDALPAVGPRCGEPLADAVRDADYFLTVARNLLHDPARSKLDQHERVRQTLTAVAEQGLHEFPLFGRDRNVDFGQFKPRGHYEKSPELQTYFRAMMWCGRIDLRVSGGYDETGPLSSARELGAAVVLLDLLRAAGKEDDWRRFDRLLQTFVGRTDSATFDDLARATAAGVRSAADLKTAADLDRLAEAVQATDAGRQEVRGDVYVSPSMGAKVVLPRSFTLLGQKFVLDSWALTKLVFDDITWDGRKVARMVPSGLDVAFAALGNSHVVPELVGRMEGGPRAFRDRLPYQHNLAAVRAVIDGVPADGWADSAYTGWLAALRALAAPPDARAPAVTRTRAWAMKQTNTQLASWTQLRHDTVLYAKPSYTCMPSCYYPAGFVEPVPAFWGRLATTAARTAELIAETPFPAAVRPTQAKQVAFFRGFAAQVRRLRAVAEKQLARHPLTADERAVLEDVMQVGHQALGSASVPKYTGWYPALFYRGPDDCIKWDALTADVHTDPPNLWEPGCVLHQGVGGVDLLVVAVESGPDRVVYAGPTFSHYEFEVPGVGRKTDREWKADLLDGKVPPRPEWTRGYLVPVADRKPADQYLRARMLAED